VPDRDATRKRAYAAYTSFVARLEETTVKIPYNKVELRRKSYWEPLDRYALQLQSEYRISPDQLAQLIKEGVEQNWPTEQPGDGGALAKMLRRLHTETKLVVRRAQAKADMDILGRLVNMAVSQATAAGTMQNNINAEAGRRALTPGSR
jgi:hypothetical protein